jgi:hypothetical protein
MSDHDELLARADKRLAQAFACPNTPGTPWTPVWCPECDERHRARLTQQFKALAAAAAGSATPTEHDYPTEEP